MGNNIRHLTVFYFHTAVESTFRPLRSFMPSGPLMNSEYYPGWLTHWGENIAHTPTVEVVKTLEDMLKNNINVNFYVFFGGTNFGFTAGKNLKCCFIK